METNETEHRAYVFDTETTGFLHNEVIESALMPVTLVKGAVLVEGAPTVALWKPSKPIEAGAWAVHGIDPEKLKEMQPSSAFSLPKHNHYIIGHNVIYDWKAAGSPSNVRLIDTLPMARTLWPQFKSHAQLALLYELDPEAAKKYKGQAHSAGVDVMICLEVLQHISNAQVEPWTVWEDAWQFSKKASIPTVMPFGKHKGVSLQKLPPDYVAWALANLNKLDDNLRSAMEKLL